VALILIKADEVQLLGRAHAGKYAGLPQAATAIAVGMDKQAFQLIPRHRCRVRILGKVHLVGHGEGRGGVVAGHHQYPDAGVLAGFEGGHHFGARRVEESHQAQPGQLVGPVGLVLIGQLAVG
jgi:hypothetical protein